MWWIYDISDDLVGFFKGIPQDRLTDAVHQIAAAWRAQRQQHVL